MSKKLSSNDITPPVTPAKNATAVSANAKIAAADAAAAKLASRDRKRNAERVDSDDESLYDEDGVRYTARQKKTRLRHVDFVGCESDEEEMDEVARDLLAKDDDEANIVMTVPKKAAAFHPLYINKMMNFKGGGSVENADVLAMFEKRNVIPPNRLPVLSEALKVFTSSITIGGEVVPAMPIMGRDQEVKKWELLPLVKNGRYQSGQWKKNGVVDYRGTFAMLNVAVRLSSSLYNLGSPERDREWMQMTAQSIGQCATPDNGKTWWFILTVKTPHVKTFMDLVVRNEEFKKAYVQSRRPLVTFSDVTFAYNRFQGVPELQTMYPKGNQPGMRSSIVWTGNYKGLGENFATQAVSQFNGQAWEDAAETEDESV